MTFQRNEQQEIRIERLEVNARKLGEMIQLIADGTISSKLAKKVFLLLAEGGGTAKALLKKRYGSIE